jgi:two-component system, sensor histidine kinase and response regulator
MSYILLIEDNQSNADMVIRLLESLNLEVRHSLRGFEGAHMARTNRPALILMDFNLPDIDGRVLVLQLKKRFGAEAPPIIALTARTGEKEMRLAELYGCNAFVSKPFAPEELIALVKRFVPQLINAGETPDTPPQVP